MTTLLQIKDSNPVPEGFIIDRKGLEIYYQTAVDLMDDDLREAVHGSCGTDTDQTFYNAYCLEHLDKFGEVFDVS